MTDQPTEKPTVDVRTQLEFMEQIITKIDIALPWINSARVAYSNGPLSKRKFAKKEIALLDESYNKVLTVWYNMKRRRKREEKNVRSKI